MARDFTFSDIVKTSEKVAWTLEDVVGGRSPDLSKPLLPESLAGVENIKCLNAVEKLKLNQIRGNSYAYLFNYIEESIITAIMQFVHQMRLGDEMLTRALLRFVEEEVKHQQMFRAFNKAFEAKFETHCYHLGERMTAEAVAETLGKNTPLAVLITVLHIEWVSQRHFADCFRGDGETKLDPLFVSVLRNHWIEEAQHTKADLLLIDQLTAKATPAEIGKAVEDYMEIGKAIDGLLYQQVELDIQTLEKALSRTFNQTEKDELIFTQSTSCRRGLLGMGMTHPPFVKFLHELSPAAAAKVAEMATAIG